jgi:hypothetical protein
MECIKKLLVVTWENDHRFSVEVDLLCCPLCNDSWQIALCYHFILNTVRKMVICAYFSFAGCGMWRCGWLYWRRSSQCINCKHIVFVSFFLLVLIWNHNVKNHSYGIMCRFCDVILLAMYFSTYIYIFVYCGVCRFYKICNAVVWRLSAVQVWWYSYCRL